MQDEANETFFTGADDVLENDQEEAYMLRIKTQFGNKKGKELDPKFFNEKEWAPYRVSDVAELKSLLDNQAVMVLTPEQAQKVPKARIFWVPFRFVRTSRVPF